MQIKRLHCARVDVEEKQWRRPRDVVLDAPASHVATLLRNLAPG
jgi:hypothetical protein